MAATGWTQGIRNGLEVIELTTPASICTIALHGAQVLSFAPRDDREWLWISDAALFQVGKALSTAGTLDDMLLTASKLIFEVVNAERSVLLLKDPKTVEYDVIVDDA